MNAWPNNLLKEFVDQIAAMQTDRIPELEKIIVETKKKLDAAHAARQRAENFPVAAAPLCPKCWMDGKEVELVQVDSNEARVDKYRCRACRSQFPLPY